MERCCLNEQHCAVHIGLLHNGFEPKWVCCLSSSVDFLFRPAPPFDPAVNSWGTPKGWAQTTWSTACSGLPWHVRVSMNIAFEHVNKKQNIWLFLLKRHHCIIRFNLMQGTTKSGNWRSSSLIHFAPCVRTAPYGPITKNIKKLQYFLHKQGSHRTRVLE